MIPIAFFFGGGRRTDQTAGRSEGLSGSMTVAWDDQFKRQNIMWKVPRNIRMNDNIVVREDEIAVFYRDGKVLAYLDRPDRYALTSQNVAVLGKLIQALSGVVQQAEVYYLQKRIFDGKFGTQDRSEEHTSELQSRLHLVCRLLLEKKTDHDVRST